MPLKKIIVLWLVYFCLLLVVSLPHGMRTHLSYSIGDPACEIPAIAQIMFSCRSPKSLYPLSTLDDVIRIYQKNDQAAIAATAKHIIDKWKGRLNSDQISSNAEQKTTPPKKSGWIGLPSWPPGMLLIEMILYALSASTPVLIIYVIMTSGLWAAVMTQVSLLALKRYTPILAFFLPLGLFLTEPFSWMTSIGVLNTEPISIATFLLGIGFMMFAVSTPSALKCYAVLSGACIATSAYFRPQTDYIMAIAVIIFFIGSLTLLIHKYKKDNLFRIKPLFTGFPWLAILGIVLLCYYGCTLPYRAINHGQMIDNTNHATWHFLWDRMTDIPKDMPNEITDGGNIGCDVDPDTCSAIEAMRAKGEDPALIPGYLFKLTMQSVIHHPVKWLEVKSSYFWKFWFNGSVSRL